MIRKIEKVNEREMEKAIQDILSGKRTSVKVGNVKVYKCQNIIRIDVPIEKVFDRLP